MAVVLVIAAAVVIGVFVTSSSRFRKQQKRFGAIGIDISTNPSVRSEDVAPASARDERAVRARMPMLVVGLLSAAAGTATFAAGIVVLGGLLVLVAAITLAASVQGFVIFNRTQHGR